MAGSVAVHSAVLLAVGLGGQRPPAHHDLATVVSAPRRPLEIWTPQPVEGPPACPEPTFVTEPSPIEPELVTVLPEAPVAPPTPEPVEVTQPLPPLDTPPPAAAWLAPLRAEPAGELPEQPPEPVTAAADASPADSAFVQAVPLDGVNAKPGYPFLARQRGIEGSVVVLLEVDTRGRVTAAHVESSSGSTLLDDTALARLSTWRFEPARRGAVAVPSTYRKEVRFQLREP